MAAAQIFGGISAGVLSVSRPLLGYARPGVRSGFRTRGLRGGLIQFSVVLHNRLCAKDSPVHRGLARTTIVNVRVWLVNVKGPVIGLQSRSGNRKSARGSRRGEVWARRGRTTQCGPISEVSYKPLNLCADTVKQSILMSAIGMHRRSLFNRPSFRRLKANARRVPKIRQRVTVLESPSRVHEKGRSAVDVGIQVDVITT
jgi:hypothetical protein